MNQQINKFSAEDISQLQMLLGFLNSKPTQHRLINLEQYFSEYIGFAQNNLSKKSCDSIRLSFKRMLNFFSPSKDLISITQADIEKFICHIRKSAPKGYYVYFSTLKAAFNKAKDWNYISENPFSKIKLPKKQNNKPAYLTSAKFNQVLEKIEIKVVKDISTLCFYTGLRLSEATFLKWRNIDLKEKFITVGDSEFKTKTRKQRIVPMNIIVEQIFIDRMEKLGYDKDEYVFRKSKNKSFTTDFISKRFKKACKAAGIDEMIHFHSLRHSAASNLVKKKVPLYTVQKILGHSSITVTQLYAHLEIDDMREALESLE